MIERLAIFDEHYHKIGEAIRDEVHAKGYWHEVFHCWVIEKIEDEWMIYLQLRSKLKKDYPNQFDITAAGHLLATETILDGVRELHEELGINIAFEELKALGVIPYKIYNEIIKDYEFANVFIYEITNGLDTFQIQREELDGMYYMRLQDFFNLSNDTITSALVTGYYYQGDEKVSGSQEISLADMQALPQNYLKPFTDKLQALMK
ncbi:NUDIX domain-containing protein [Solibacillus sp. MA9]|uniref:NUDIX domain-containing protein n=1 Tax=Solibacillus palustris TaxID=2908203 RepID=A0ABS9UDS4_9BACL|nr:NUDIX domain-containing protein [Solibacillus sp. MA9]MCH7322497.1 NUDIX domain-containing protein [Solibacillus sp. MA9]